LFVVLQRSAARSPSLSYSAASRNNIAFVPILFISFARTRADRDLTWPDLGGFVDDGQPAPASRTTHLVALYVIGIGPPVGVIQIIFARGLAAIFAKGVKQTVLFEYRFE
jgi:hypothetical protein